MTDKLHQHGIEKSFQHDAGASQPVERDNDSSCRHHVMHTFLGDGLACLGGSALAIGVAPALLAPGAVLSSALGGARLRLSACLIEK